MICPPNEPIWWKHFPWVPRVFKKGSWEVPGGAWQFFCRILLRTYIMGGVVVGLTGGFYSELAESSGQSIRFHFPRICSRCFLGLRILVVLTWGKKSSLDKLGTLTPDFPTQKPTELANSRDCPMEEKTWYCNKTYKQKPNRNVEDHMSDFNIIHIKQKHDCKQNGNIEKKTENQHIKHNKNRPHT